MITSAPPVSCALLSRNVSPPASARICEPWANMAPPNIAKFPANLVEQLQFVCVPLKPIMLYLAQIAPPSFHALVPWNKLSFTISVLTSEYIVPPFLLALLPVNILQFRIIVLSSASIAPPSLL